MRRRLTGGAEVSPKSATPRRASRFAACAPYWTGANSIIGAAHLGNFRLREDRPYTQEVLAMIDNRLAHLFWILVPTLLAPLIVLHPAVAHDADGLRVTDYFISHTSNEPFYAQQNLDPRVTLHVREVVLPGRERTVAQEGKVLLFIHGFSVPGYVAFDTDSENCSLMRYFARAGWDTFALDFEGFGLSTRPLVMDDPAAFPTSKAPIHTDVTVRDVERAVDFISALRGVQQVHLLGWSQGASLEAPLYAIQHPEKVAGLVLFGVTYDNPMSVEEREKSAADSEAQKVIHSVPSLERWAGLGTKEEIVVPGCFDAHREALLASDPKSGENGGAVRVPAGRAADEDLTKPHFDAAKITAPTLVIRGAADTSAEREDNQKLMTALGSTVKEYVEIPDAGHFLHFENVNVEFYQAIQNFLEPEK
jgi:pimeloyl-ACP methyl ester carboxylesterase